MRKRKTTSSGVRSFQRQRLILFRGYQKTVCEP